MKTGETQAERRDEVASALFSLWVVSGLFLDGWAHNAELAESFWTPWHAVLYSGFFAGSLYTLLRARRARREGGAPLGDPLVGLGMLAFLVGGVGDGVWHSIFGVEEDLEALLSPTHLLLMSGGLLLTTSSVRAAWGRYEQAPGLRALLPAIVGTTLAVAVIGFFLQFSSPFRPEHDRFLATADDATAGLIVLGMLVTTVLLLGATFVLRARWRLPTHTLMVVYGGFALLMTGLHGFREWPLLLPALLAGTLADALSRQGVSDRILGALVPPVLWLAWFATYAAGWGLGWAPELWLGTVAFSSLTGLGLSYLAVRPNPPGQTSERDLAVPDTRHLAA